MELIIGLILFANVFLGGLLLADYVYRTGGTMEERKALVFEIYRYAVCFIMVIVFGLMAFQLIGGLVGLTSGGGDATALAGPGIGAILSLGFFMVHWFLKNPGCPKASGS